MRLSVRMTIFPEYRQLGYWALTKVFRAEGRVRGAVRRLIWIQIFAITDFIMFSLLWRRQQQIAGLVFSIQVTFADNFYTQFVMLFDAAGFSENPTLCTALSPGFLFPCSELGFYFIYHLQNSALISRSGFNWQPFWNIFRFSSLHSSGSKLKIPNSKFVWVVTRDIPAMERAEMRHRRPHITDSISNINIVRFN